MIAEHERDTSTQKLAQSRWVEQVCARFERNWRQGLPSRIEDHLTVAQAHDRTRLLEELLAVEFELRFPETPSPALSSYFERFPDDTELIQRVFNSVAFDCRDAEEHAETIAAIQPADERQRYELGDEIARGGMGLVVRCRDLTLGRELALKTLLPKHLNQSEAALRFVNEAQITARLQHPGVPPVHELGRLMDGRPFLTMRLVNGRTLSEILKRDGSSDSAEIHRRILLDILHQVCQTMAYAHSRDVIHRDLKPSNVMVGAFDEVQVMDWGLAKELSPHNSSVADKNNDLAEAAVIPGPHSHESTRLSPSDSRWTEATVTHIANENGSASQLHSIDSSAHRVGDPPSTESRVRVDRSEPLRDERALTSAGLILGTLSYMPPEQARGETRDLDKRADVFCLGAMLCEILTGKPPYWRENETAERDVLSDVMNAAQGRLQQARQRLHACGAEVELVRLAEDCLQASRDARPADAEQVAQRLGDYLRSVDERLRQAELQNAQAVERVVQARKRTRLLRVLLLLLGVVTIGSAVAAFTFQNLADQREQARIGETRERQAAQQSQSNAERAEAIAKRERDAARDAEKVATAAKQSAEIAIADLYSGTGLMEVKQNDTHKGLLYFAAAARQASSNADRRWANRIRFRAFSRGLPSPSAFLPTDGIVDEISFHPTAPCVITKLLNGPNYTIWNLLTEQPLNMPQELGSIAAAAWNNEGTRLAVGTRDGHWFLCDFQWEPKTPPLHSEPTIRVLQQGRNEGAVTRFAFDSVSRWLAIVTWKQIRVWDIEHQRWLAQAWEHPKPIVSAQINHARQEIVTCALDHRFRVFELKAETTEPILTGVHGAPRWGFTFLRPVLSSDGTSLVTTHDDAKLTFWDLANRSVRQRIDSPVETIFSVRGQPDGQSVAVCGKTGWCAIDFEGRQVQATRHEHFLFAADYLPDGRLVTAGSEGLANIWSHFTSDGRYFMSVGRGLTVQKAAVGLRVLATDSSKPAGPILKRDWVPTCAAFSPDDRFVATAGPAGDENNAGWPRWLPMERRWQPAVKIVC